MKENARQGFWNGAKPPFGYKVEIAEQRGQKAKKRLAIDSREAEIVRKIYGLYLHGEKGVPLGIKNVVNYLNTNGIRNRTGGLFTAKTTHEILTRTTYIGRHKFNARSAKTGQMKTPDEVIELAVPAIVPEANFLAVQDRLKQNNPQKTPPRVVNGPCVLTGIAQCATCGGAMTLRTGKGGRYRYYTCLTCVRMGKTACKGRSVPMDYLDNLVIQHFEERILQPARLKSLLEQLATKVAQGADAEHRRLSDLDRQERDVRARLERLYEALEMNRMEPDDVFTSRLSALRAQREELLRLKAGLKRRLMAPRAKITPDKLDAFARAVRARLHAPDPRLRKAYLRLFVSRIEVDDAEVRISGPKGALARGAEEPGNLEDERVPSFDREWRPLGDSNPCYRLKERKPSYYFLIGRNNSR
jgi:site-specific DNA recombinase